jgi:hypothetical protein
MRHPDPTARRLSFPDFACLVLAVTLGVGAPGSECLASESGIARSERPEDAAVYFITPSDGQTVSSPVTVRFGLRDMGVAPAGVDKENTGHHHLIVDADLPPMDLPIPKNEHYRHFGAGQTEVELELEPGTHTLQLLLGDQNHVPHDPPVVSERITIVVEAAPE